MNAIRANPIERGSVRVEWFTERSHRECDLKVISKYVLKYRRLLKSGRRVLTGRGEGVEPRPRNLILHPELSDPGRGLRAAIVARRLNDGLLAAGGALMKSVRQGGSLMLIGVEKADHAIRAARSAFEDLEVVDFRNETIPDNRSEDLYSFLDEWSPDIVFAPSPIEDREVYRTVAELHGRSGSSIRTTGILLYELRNPLLPNRVVDITEVMVQKETLGVELGGVDLFHALNQYRSVTNMKGRGFAEAFFSIPGHSGEDDPDASRLDTNGPAMHPIPFFEGFDRLKTGNVERWEGDGPRKRILVLSPHFDDETIGCGGTLLRHSLRGDPTSVLFFTDGREGDPRESDRELVSAIRRREAVEAASILGVGRLEFLDQPETRLRPEENLEKRVDGIMDDIDPGVVYLPSFLENHVDHIELNRIFHRILKRRKRRLEIRLFGVWTVIPPNLIVDIGGEIEEKIRGVSAYRSQITQVDYLSVTLALNRYWSLKYGDGKGYLETFHSIGSEGYCSIIESLGIDRGVV